MLLATLSCAGKKLDTDRNRLQQRSWDKHYPIRKPDCILDGTCHSWQDALQVGWMMMGWLRTCWQAFITATDFEIFLLSLSRTFVGWGHQPAWWVPVSVPPAVQGRRNMDLLLAFFSTELNNWRTLTSTVCVPFCSVLLMHRNVLSYDVFVWFISCRFHELDLRQALPHEHDSHFHTFFELR